MTHAVETMAWSTTTPWHGLGNQVRANATPEEMLVAAGLDWSIKKWPLSANVNGVQVPVRDKFAFVRDKDNKIMTLAGPDWKPLQNVEAMEFFRDFAETGGAQLETAGALHGGKIVWALASIQQGFTINGDDTVRGYILLTSPHVVGKAITVRTTSVRVVCANTLAMAESEGAVQYRQSHLTEFNHDAAREAVKLARNELEKFELEANALNQLKMSGYDTVRFLAQFFVTKPDDVPEQAFVATLMSDAAQRPRQMNGILDAMYDAPGATPGNAWGVLNGVTYWADHTAGNNADSRLLNSWLGARAKLKNDVKTALVEMAGA